MSSFNEHDIEDGRHQDLTSNSPPSGNDDAVDIDSAAPEREHDAATATTITTMPQRSSSITTCPELIRKQSSISTTTSSTCPELVRKQSSIATTTSSTAQADIEDDTCDLQMIDDREEPTPPTIVMQDLLETAPSESSLKKRTTKRIQAIEAPTTLVPPRPFSFNFDDDDDDEEEDDAVNRKIRNDALRSNANNSTSNSTSNGGDIEAPLPLNNTRLTQVIDDDHHGRTRITQRRLTQTFDTNISSQHGNGNGNGNDHGRTRIIQRRLTQTFDTNNSSQHGHGGGPVDTDDHIDAFQLNNLPSQDYDSPIAINMQMTATVTTANPTITPDLRRVPTFRVPVAFAVHQQSMDTVYTATPAEPTVVWWKQKQAKCFFAIVCILLIVAAIAVGMSFSTTNNDEITPLVIVVDSTNSPSTSFMPSSPPSLPPTAKSSNAPSSSPSECARTITSGMQTINTPLVDPIRMHAAVDGTDMVVIAQDRNETSSQFAHVMFYDNDGGDGGSWNVTHSFRERYRGKDYSVSLSGGRALLGFPDKGNKGEDENGDVGAVYVYEKNELGEWENAGEIFVTKNDDDDESPVMNFGQSLDMDGRFACVSDLNYFYLFRRTANENDEYEDGYENKIGDNNNNNITWVQFDKMERGRERYGKCSIANNTFAIQSYVSSTKKALQLYEYDEELQGVIPLQDRFERFGPMTLGLDRLVYLKPPPPSSSGSGGGGGVFVYHREEEEGDDNVTETSGSSSSGIFILRQELSPDHASPKGMLAIDNGLIVVGEKKWVHIYSEQEDEVWVETETITFEKPYKEFLFSGHNLVGVNGDGVQVFNVESCV
eukprot:CAMPEP_0201664684 /NCGR_PEP_ID=MMETSP0494-20130426/6063_1 /ASSEMBLY_ACC=CAM_ASM_000839 /TAXON_ID=420259 /ORGANISM="Thalassiosira gravida, Strain GMp14c1" /LENGTH=825 /DNA_ID=CAMNT_0048143503 /DNA_START=29 /DNA_END=2506 /DNA_ORIENTATION=-